MGVFDNLIGGFGAALSPTNLLWVGVGVVIGTLVGILPGLGPPATLALLLPLTISLPPATGLIMMAGLYHGAKFSGSIAAVLLNIPTEPSSVVLCFDGHQLARQGRAGAALGVSAISGFVASTFGVIGLTVAAPVIARLAIDFGPPEYGALMVFALLLVIMMTSDAPVKGFISMAVGLLLATVGVDIFSGEQRFTFGSVTLVGGISFITVSVGLFAVGEVLVNVERQAGRPLFAVPSKVREVMPTWADLRASRAAIAIGTVIGFFVGSLPGGGSTVASFLSYTVVKRTSKHPERFGHGAIEGVAGPEAANNSESGAAMIPLLSLGLPGTASTAVMLAALLIYGLQPGPLLFTQHPEIAWPVIASLYIGNVALLILNLPMIPIWVKILRIPYWVLYPAILVLAVIGVYSIRQSMFDLFLLAGFGLLGYVFHRLSVPVAPLLMAFVLGPMAENAVRQSLTLSDNNPLIFVERPVSATILGIAVVGAIALAVTNRRGRAPVAVAVPAEGGPEMPSPAREAELSAQDRSTS
jgi:putative tricarboxylic transport membrane protein